MKYTDGKNKRTEEITEENTKLAKEALLLSVKHNIDKPLKTIIKLSSLLEDVNISTKDMLLIAKQIESNGTFMRKTIFDLLDRSNLEKMKITQIHNSYYFDFFSCVKHELNASINSIVILSTILKDENTSTDEYNQSIEIIKSSSLAITETLNELIEEQTSK